MTILRITNGFDKMSDANLELRANEIHGLMDGNANFATPEPTLVVFMAGIVAYSSALTNAQDGSKLAIAIKNQKREELTTLLHKLANYVLFTAQGDRVVAISSGFSISKEPVPAPPIGKPENLRVENGLNPGELLTRVQKVKGALVYLHQFTADPTLAEASWKSLTRSSVKATFTNLQSGTKYYCRVAAVGTKEQLVYSDVVSHVSG